MGDSGMAGPDYSFETAWHARGITQVAGVDEVGRGPLAGPVVAAAVIPRSCSSASGPERFQAGQCENRALLAEGSKDRNGFHREAV